MDTFGQCGLPLIVIHNTVIGQENMVIYLDSLRKTELMEDVIFGHMVGRQLHGFGGRTKLESG